MEFVATGIEGAFLVNPPAHSDDRGSFARLFCAEAFAAHGIAFEVVQANLSRNPVRNTLRGMHFQAQPHGEPKLVHCAAGRIFDVAIDLRPASPTFRRAFAVELSPGTGALFYIPAGCAHGFLTLEPHSDVLYFMGAAYVPGSGRGVRWNDPCFAIAWPGSPAVISDRDASWPDFVDHSA